MHCFHSVLPHPRQWKQPLRRAFLGSILFVSLLSCCMAQIEASDSETPVVESSPDLMLPGLSRSDAVVLGVVEGLTEYLPVSSTGHLILADHLLHRESTVPVSLAHQQARSAYLIVIQGGAILAVLLLYWRKLLSILLGMLGRDREGLQLGLKIGIAFVPAAALGLMLGGWIESSLFNPRSVAIGLVIGSVIMVGAEWYRKHQQVTSPDLEVSTDCLQSLSYRGALTVGCMQCLALCPGMSRSMVTIVGGYFAGLTPRASAEFSFLLGLLTLSAASLYSLLRSWEPVTTTLELDAVLIGIAVATVVAMLAVKWFVSYLSRHGLLLFALYRLLLAAAIGWFLWDS